MSPVRARPARDLLADGSLHLILDPDTEALVQDWLPRLPDTAVEGDAGAAIVVRGVGGSAATAPSGEPTLRLGEAGAWVSPGEGRVELAGFVGGSTGLIRLHEKRAELRPGAGTTPGVKWELYSMLTIAAALLLGRMGRALVHAGAVVVPGGAAWLLVGDARSGKSTTCVGLIESGWDYVSDDQVVVGRGDADGSHRVEGWPRSFHLDPGRKEGRITGERLAVDPATLGPGRWRRSAPLAGLLFPEITDRRATRLEPMEPARALTLLVRQTPWLLADPAVGPVGLELLTSVSRRPAFRVRLGRDTYRDKDALLACMKPVLDL